MDEDESIEDVVRALCLARRGRAFEDGCVAESASTVDDDEFRAAFGSSVSVEASMERLRVVTEDPERALDAELDEIERALEEGGGWTSRSGTRVRTRDAREPPEMWRARFIDVLDSGGVGTRANAGGTGTTEAARVGGGEAFGARAGDETLAAAAIPATSAGAALDALREDGPLVDDIVRRIDRATASLARAQKLLAEGQMDAARRGRRDGGT